MADNIARRHEWAVYRALMAAGFTRESIQQAIRAGALETLRLDGSHRGLLSVQLQPPDEDERESAGASRGR